MMPESHESTLSHFQQEVFSTLRKIPSIYARYNCLEHGVEKDIVVHSYGGQMFEAPLNIEVNGVYHYCRNSEHEMGKDVIKRTFLETKGLKSLSIPYFEWSILEN